MGSATSTPTFQALIGNIKNADGSTPIYSAGAYTFKNASAVTTFAVDASGAVTVGPASGTQIHVVNGSVNIKSVTISNLANGGTATLVSGSAAYIHMIRIDAAGNLRVGQMVTTGGATVSGVLSQTIGVGSIALSATFNNAGTVNIYWSAGFTYTVQNNTGIAINLTVSSFALS